MVDGSTALDNVFQLSQLSNSSAFEFQIVIYQTMSESNIAPS